MSLAEQIDALETSVRCKSCAWYDKQDPDTRAAFDRYVERQNPENPNYKPLFDLCRLNGLDISSKSFRDHIGNHHRRVR